MKKRAAPLEWNFVSEQNYTKQYQRKNAHQPAVGPALPGACNSKEPEKARFVPLDIDP